MYVCMYVCIIIALLKRAHVNFIIHLDKLGHLCAH